MTDPRITKLAQLLINYSVKLKKGENVLMVVPSKPGPGVGSAASSSRSVSGPPAWWDRRAFMRHP